MSKQISAAELAEIVHILLTGKKPGQGDGEATAVEHGQLDEASQYQRFMTDVAEVVANHCGGEVRNPAEEFEGVWYVGIHGNESLPDTAGGIWAAYDPEGELFGELAKALRADGITDYCGQVCGGGECGTGPLCVNGIDSSTHMPPVTVKLS
ncbi:hypothetical protein [Herbaspirillum huttiense]|uniref:hypothetical protein n=1 Tax=Herbaspirillum huttiense TaxID=863372 RepID=UPI0039AFA223